MPEREAISAVRGQFTFTADGLCITRDMLATWWGPVARPGGVTARLWLPGVVFDAGRLPGGHAVAEVEGFTVELHARPAAPVPLPGPAGDSGPSRPGPEAAALESLSGTAAVIAAEFLACFRLRLRQYWATPTGAPHPLDATLYDAATGEVIASQAGAPGRPVPFDMLAGVPGSSALDGAALRAELPGILTAQATGRTGLPERLLFSAFGKLWSGDPDPQTAVFLAVTACETKVKAALGVDVADRGRPLLTYFDAGCRSATGQSLRQHRELWARLESLIATRNRVAHRGERGDAPAGRGTPGRRGCGVRLAGFPGLARAAPGGNQAACLTPPRPPAGPVPPGRDTGKAGPALSDARRRPAGGSSQETRACGAARAGMPAAGRFTAMTSAPAASAAGQPGWGGR